ncbi:retrovirus-related pol polyprotein from transposon TNT 1-94, partial [Tanacetum coccineum]
ITDHLLVVNGSLCGDLIVRKRRIENRLSVEEPLSIGLRGKEDQLSAKHQLAVKGLSECKALESNIKRIQVKYVVKEVEDYLKTYSPAGMDINWSAVSISCPDKFVCKLDSLIKFTCSKGNNDNLPQLLDSRGGSHVTNVPAFDKDDFTSWKIRFLVFLDGLEPYLTTTLEDGPFVLMSNLSTHANPLPKRPSDTIYTKIAALRLKFNAFKALEGEKVNGTYTQLKCLLNDLENNGVIISQSKDSDSDVEEDNRTNNEFMVGLNVEYHKRALLANQKRFYKRSRRDCPSNKTSTPSYPSSNTSFNKSKSYTPLFTLNIPQNSSNHQKDYKGKYKGLKPEMAVLSQRIDELTKGKNDKGKEDEGTTKFKAFMAITEDESSVGKGDARSDYTHVDLHYVEDQRKKLVNKFNALKQDLALHKSKLCNLKNIAFINCSLKNETSSKVTLDQLLSEQIPRNIVKALKGKGKRKENNSSKYVLFTKADVSTSEFAPMITSDSEEECDNQEHLPPLPKLTGAEPSGASKILISLSDLTANMADLTLNTASKEIKKSSNKMSQTYVIKKKTEPKQLVAQISYPDKNALPSTAKLLLTFMEEVKGIKNQILVPSDTSSSVSQASSSKNSKQKDYLKRSVWYLDSDCSRHMTGVKQYLHKYSKELGLKVVFGDNSSGDTEGYGSVNCNGITFTKVAYVNGLKHNLISISQLCDANFKVLFTKTEGSILNEKDEVVLIAPRKIYVYVIDMSSYNTKSNACFYAKPSPTERRNRTLIEDARTMLNSAFLPKQFWGEAVNAACYIQNRSIIVKIHKKTAYEVFRGRAPYINYFHVFGCPMHIHNHRDYLGKFDEKADDGFFLGYSSMAKAFRVFNIRRQEMEETFHITFSEDDEAISQTSTEGDAINFNEVNSFPDDEFSEPRTSDTLCNANIEYFSYVHAFDRLSTNNLVSPEPIITSSSLISSTLEDSSIPNIEEVVPTLDEAVHPESAASLESTDLQEDDRDEPSIDDQPLPQINSTLADSVSGPLVPQDRWSKEKHIELVNIIGETLAGITTRSRIRYLDVASASECLYVNFLSEIEPKKLIEALEEVGSCHDKGAESI